LVIWYVDNLAHWLHFFQTGDSSYHPPESGIQYNSPQSETGLIYRRSSFKDFHRFLEASEVTGGGKQPELMYILYKPAYSICPPE